VISSREHLIAEQLRIGAEILAKKEEAKRW
jgi:hypothetical protein